MKCKIITTIMVCVLTAGVTQAQLSSNPDKFLGNITTSYNIDYGNEKFYQLWNQITPENESKWDQVEGQRRGTFNWTNTDRINNYAKQHNFPFKWHTLIWGSQYPGWMNSLSETEQLKAIEEWMDAIKGRYPDLAMIDVVNEAVPGHAPAPYKNALGGDGVSGYDWIVKAFEMAYERWPDAILIYNDYNTFQWNTDAFIELVRAIRDAGAPIDAYGCQSHDLTGCSATTLKNSMAKIQNALKMPMYITEYDIGTANDNDQLRDYKAQIPLLWEADYCAGITLWGYIYGKTWTTDGNSGLIKNGQDRPAMTWLRDYMQTDAAKNAKSPFPGMVKEASVYVRPSSIRVTKGEPTTIDVRAAMRTKTVDNVKLYANSTLVATMTEAPYVAEYTPATTGKHNLRAVVTTTDGTTYERLSSITAYNARKAHKQITIPGTMQFEDFDEGGEGLTYHDSDSKNEGTTAYRTDSEGVDIVTLSGGYGLGYTVSGEWLEYTVNVAESGYYTFEASVSCGNNTNPAFRVLMVDEGKSTQLCQVNIPQTDNGQWANYVVIDGLLAQPLEAGQHTLRVEITAGNGNMDKIVFTHLESMPDQFTSVSQLTGGVSFAITDRQQHKAFYCSDNQNLQFGDYANAFASNVMGNYFKLEPAADTNYYLLRLYKPDGSPYTVFGSPGYLNSQPADQWCCFILGLNNQNGQDMKNGALWDVQYVDNMGFTLRNIGTGLYLHDAGPAKYADPAYFNLCTLDMINGIKPLSISPEGEGTIYTLSGQRVQNVTWPITNGQLKKGIYIVNGRKVIVK